MATRLFLGTDQGVFTLSPQNGGWAIASQDLKEWSIQGLAVDPSAPERVVAATRGDGVWMTEDRGAHWMKPSHGKPGPGKTRCVIFDPQNPRRLLVGGEPIEVYVSEDLGATWDRLESVRRLEFIDRIHYGVQGVEPHLRDIAIDPKDSNVVYAALQVGGIIKTEDGGGTWTLLEEGLDRDVHTIVVSTEDSDAVVVATGGADSRSGRVNGRALYRSTNAGETWSPVAMQFTQHYSMPLVAHPRQPKVMYAALANGTPSNWLRESGAEALLIRSTDGGERWEELATGLPAAARDFAKGIAFDPQDPDTIYVGVDTGILTSRDGGSTWRKQEFKFPRAYDMKCC